MNRKKRKFQDRVRRIKAARDRGSALVLKFTTDLSGWEEGARRASAALLALATSLHSTADDLLQANACWSLAPEEDGNTRVGMVYLQRFNDSGGGHG